MDSIVTFLDRISKCSWRMEFSFRFSMDFQCFPNFFEPRHTEPKSVWKEKFWQFGKGNFNSLKREILTVWKGKFWQFEKGNFDSLKREILTVWKWNFWQFEKENFDSLKREILTVWKGNFLTVFATQ